MGELSVRELPLFPLPEVVLFPQEVLPLHIFESRYRIMLQSVLESDSMFGNYLSENVELDLIVSLYETCGAPIFASTLNSLNILSTRISKCNSPIPAITV